ncbi:MAG: hypothetical protein PHS96_10700 [Anaerolineales bacterium]|nr:hypothetical protein [Anaerolineales bacterium]
MVEQPTSEMIQKMGRWFAVECNNRAWDLASKTTRTADEDRELLFNAYAAAHHWRQVGTPLQQARADLLLAHAHALCSHGELAWHYARRCLSFFEANPAEDWDLAFAHAAMALAAAANQDAGLHARHYALAKEYGQAIKDEEDRRIFWQEFARIPAG